MLKKDRLLIAKLIFVPLIMYGIIMGLQELYIYLKYDIYNENPPELLEEYGGFIFSIGDRYPFVYYIMVFGPIIYYGYQILIGLINHGMSFFTQKD